MRLNCPSCALQLKRRYWKDGRDVHNNPRRLYCTDSPILLVSCLYACENDHRFLSHDQRIIDRCKTENVPFVLLHKLGFTKKFLHFVVLHVTAGLSSSAIAETMSSMWNIPACVGYLPLPENGIENWTSASRKTITAGYNYHYFLNMQKYSNMMLKITGTWVLMDHTFKTAANIGYWDKNRRWKTLFSSIFLVMNEKKEVMSWTLTKSTGFIHVRQSLYEVRNRMQKAAIPLSGIVIDNCCHWRELLQEMFGKTVLIKLDLFHAIKRVIETVSKKHRFFHVFKNEFGLVFRALTDRQSSRTLPTPSCEQLIENLDNFVSQWENIPDSPLGSQKTIKSLYNIRKHVTKGCLSDIPPGIGTNVNENIHKTLKRRISSDRKGLLTAVASFGHFLYNWNQRRTNPNSNVIPIEEQPVDDDDAPYIFGTSLIHSPQSSAFRLHVEEVSETIQNDFHDLSSDQEVSAAEEMSELDFLGIDSEELSMMKSWAIHCTNVMAMFKGHKDLQLTNFVFWSSYLYLIFKQQESCSTNLHQLVDTHELQMIDSGNQTLANAALDSLREDEKLSSCLAGHGMDNCADSAAAMTNKLKEEVFAQQNQLYEFFKELDINLSTWVKKEFNSKSGYALPALANFLCVPIILFTTASLYPLITIIPWRKAANTNDGVLIIAFDCQNHRFFGVKRKPQEPQKLTSPVKATVSCKCGSSKKQKPGSTNCNKYKCDCFKKLEACGEKCLCLCCSNPRGKNEAAIPSEISSPTCPRKRYKTSMQCKFREIKVDNSMRLQCDFDKGTLAISIINYFIMNKLPYENDRFLNAVAYALFSDTKMEQEEIGKLMKYWRDQFFTRALVLDSKY